MGYKGYVCRALYVGSLSRCCPARGERFSCRGCNHLSQCCSSYEYCVSCCLNPSKTKEGLALRMKITKPVIAGRGNLVIKHANQGDNVVFPASLLFQTTVNCKYYILQF